MSKTEIHYKPNNFVTGRFHAALVASGYPDAVVSAYDCENGLRVIFYKTDIVQISVAHADRLPTLDEMQRIRTEFAPDNIQMAIVLEPGKDLAGAVTMFELIYMNDEKR